MVVDALVICAALHREPHYRDFNPGLGVEVELPHEGRLTPYLGAASYSDSHANQSWLVGFGGRLTYGQRSQWHYGPDVMLGQAKNTEYRGVMLLPGGFVGYSRLNLHVTFMTSDALGFYVRYEIPTN